MSLIEAILLGIVQGATEFLPISSKTHLVVVPAVLGRQAPSLEFIVLLHLGTLVALVAALWRELLALARDLPRPHSEGRRLTGQLILATVPAGVLGLAFEETFERLLSHPTQAAFALLATAALLSLAEWTARRRPGDLRRKASWTDAVVMGLAQAAALLPGVSRSGSTMAAGLAAGLRRHEAARFSFLMAVPVVAAAGALEVPEVVGAGFGPPEWAGFAAAVVSGYAAVRLLLRFVKTRSFLPFAIYCVAFALIAGILLATD